MTIDQIRDELAKMRGWKRTTVHDPKSGVLTRIFGKGVPAWTHPESFVTITHGHPVPDTLQEATRLPDGWDMHMWIPPEPPRYYAWPNTPPHGPVIGVTVTGNEKYDFFSLRLLAEQAERLGPYTANKETHEFRQRLLAEKLKGLT